MKEFIRRWSNWWILSPKRKQIDDAFEKELNELIEREIALHIHDVMVEFHCERFDFGRDKKCEQQCSDCHWMQTKSQLNIKH